MAVWDDLVGQRRIGEQLAAAARDADALVAARAGLGARGAGTGDEAAAVAAAPSATSQMTHAWLFTGPPGSGRSTAARAFAAALHCVSPDRAMGAAPGCGFCDGCHTALVGTHADVTVLATDLVFITRDETRKLVRDAQMSPAGGRWQVIIVEDADRLTEGSGNVLLKAIEEPAPRTVWLLCAPSPEDVLPTIRSRCRHLTLQTPSAAAIADTLVRRDGVEPAMAEVAARAAQGHIGRARRLATDERARAQRAAVLKLPLRVDDLGGCLRGAQELVDTANAAAKQQAEESDEQETEDMRTALGAAPGGGGRMPRGTAGVMKDLERRQKSRTTRIQRDSLDLALIDLVGFYRDVLALQFGATVAPAGIDSDAAVRRIADSSTPESTLRRIEAVLACRDALGRNVAPLLAVESMALALRAG